MSSRLGSLKRSPSKRGPETDQINHHRKNHDLDYENGKINAEEGMTAGNWAVVESTRRRFTKSDDQQLEHLVRQFGVDNWKKIAEMTPGRSVRQVRDRWAQYLSCPAKPHMWRPEEDVLLKEKVNEFGTRWSLIAPRFDGQTQTSVRARWLVLERFAEKSSSDTAAGESGDRIGDYLPEDVDAPSAAASVPAFDFWAFWKDEP